MTIGGFIPRPRTKEIVCELLDPDDGADQLTATIRVGLSFDEIDAIKAVALNPQATFQDTWDMIAPHVVAWNAVAYDAVTGTYQPVPPPAEIGPDAFRAVDPLVTFWLSGQLSRVQFGAPGELEKKEPTSDGTPEPSDASSLGSPTPITKKRPSRPKGSTLAASSPTISAP